MSISYVIRTLITIWKVCSSWVRICLPWLENFSYTYLYCVYQFIFKTAFYPIFHFLLFIMCELGKPRLEIVFSSEITLDCLLNLLFVFITLRTMWTILRGVGKKIIIKNYALNIQYTKPSAIPRRDRIDGQDMGNYSFINESRKSRTNHFQWAITLSAVSWWDLASLFCHDSKSWGIC